MATGFLARYTQVVTVDLGDGYWAKVRSSLPRSDMEAAAQVLVAPVMRVVPGDENVDTAGTMHGPAYDTELVCRALVEWNLTDEKDAPIPIGENHPVKGPDAARRAAVGLLPSEVFDPIRAQIEGGGKTKAKEAKEAETARFRANGSGRAVEEPATPA